ncbi:MAG: hypothetical protein Q4B85_02260 [Lachnospiraceae bacterium]|nr:hypothetical protein [Lachnospiraceae bacterium]
MNKKNRSFLGALLLILLMAGSVLLGCTGRNETVDVQIVSASAVENREAPAVEPEEDPAQESSTEPTKEFAEEPTEEPTKEPEAQPAAEPAVEPAAEPVEESVLQQYYFRNAKLLKQHYEKHGIEMGFASKEEYEAAASAVITNPNALHKKEKEDNDEVYYVEETNEFAVLSDDGYIRTYFWPNAGIKYYNRQ